MQVEFKHKVEVCVLKKLHLQRLPLELLVDILKYLECHELHILQANPSFKMMFEKFPRSTLIPLYKQVFNLQSTEDLPQTINKIGSIWRNRKIISLPFWGYKTDAGILYHSIPFWIGKAFIKTHKPIVGLASIRTGSFSGCLSQDYYEFSNIVLSLSILLRQVYGFEQFSQNMDDINLKFVITHTFHSELADADELERAKFRDLKARLYNYAITLNRLLEMNDGPEVENEDLVKLPLIANLHRVEISREFKDEMYQTIKNCAQTLVVGVKDDITLEKLNKIRPPAIAETNLTSDQLSNFHFGIKMPIIPHNPFKYILFKPNQHGVLLWLDFGSKLRLELPIPYEARVWTNKVHVCIIRGHTQTAPMGLTLAYISFKGIMI